MTNDTNRANPFDDTIEVINPGLGIIGCRFCKTAIWLPAKLRGHDNVRLEIDCFAREHAQCWRTAVEFL
jgi:hypothetical protein